MAKENWAMLCATRYEAAGRLALVEERGLMVVGAARQLRTELLSEPPGAEPEETLRRLDSYFQECLEALRGWPKT